MKVKEKFTSHGSVTLQVSVLERDGQMVLLRLSVTDTGIGITPEQQQRAYMDAALVLKRRIELMLALPLQTLAGMSLQREIERIGETGAA